MLNRIRTRITWTACLLALFLVPGLASAALEKPQQKCLNGLTKEAGKVDKAQGGDDSACVKNFGKAKFDKLGPGGTVEDCLTNDVKGKVAKAKTKVAGVVCSGEADPGFGVTGTIADEAMDAELALIHAVFGSDLASTVVDGKTDPSLKGAAKCQASVAKQLGKCGAAWWKGYGECVKAGLKVGSIDNEAGLAACIGGAPPGDPKGRIVKDCSTKLTKALEKCAGIPGGGQTLDELFPGCAGEDLETCIQNTTASIEIDAIENGAVGGLSCQHNVDAFCEGGDTPGADCEDIFGSSDCPPGAPTARCNPISFASLESTSVPNGLNFALIGGSTFEVGEPDLNGVASMECGLTQPIGLVIPSLLVACLTEVGGCDPGVIDCDGGTALDLDTVHHHTVDQLMVLPGSDPNDPLDPQDPLVLAWQAAEPGFQGADCRGVDQACFETENPSCTANETCAAMCDVYCASLPGNHTQSDSGCEGFCRGGTTDRELCTLDTECQQGGINNSGDCIGGNPVAHAGSCTCDCLEVGSGGPSLAGAFWCQVGLQTVTEALTGTLCDGNDIITIIGQQCVVRTTETITNTVLYAEDDKDNTLNQFDQGSRISCVDLLAGNTSGLAQAGNQTSYDGDLGDSATRTVQVCQ